MDSQHRWDERGVRIQMTRQEWEVRLSIFIQLADQYIDILERAAAGAGDPDRPWLDARRQWLITQNGHLTRMSFKK